MTPTSRCLIGQGRYIARYLEGYNLLKRSDLVAFCAVLLRLRERMNKYYSAVLEAIARLPAMSLPETSSTTPTQRMRPMPSSPNKSKYTYNSRSSFGGGSPSFRSDRNIEDDSMIDATKLSDVEDEDAAPHKLPSYE